MPVKGLGQIVFTLFVVPTIGAVLVGAASRLAGANWEADYYPTSVLVYGLFGCTTMYAAGRFRRARRIARALTPYLFHEFWDERG